MWTQFGEFSPASNSFKNLREGKLTDAIPFDEQMLKFMPYCTQLHFNLGRAFEGVGRLEQAAKEYQLALSLGPDFSRGESRRNQLRNL